MKEIINCAAYCNGHRIADVPLDEVHEVLKTENQFVWIGLHEPSEEVLSKVQSEFGLHDLAIEDAHTAHQRPKVKLYGDSIFVVLRTAFINKERHTEFGETHFFVGPNFIVTTLPWYVSHVPRCSIYSTNPICVRKPNASVAVVRVSRTTLFNLQH